MTRALIVEDEPHIASLCVRLLAKRGVSARIATTASEAARLLSSDPAIDLAYIDIGLPDGSGLDLAREARLLRPDLPIVIATGALEEVTSPDGVILRKPFTLAEFAQAVGRATDALVRSGT